MSLSSLPISRHSLSGNCGSISKPVALKALCEMENQFRC